MARARARALPLPQLLDIEPLLLTRRGLGGRGPDHTLTHSPSSSSVDFAERPGHDRAGRQGHHDALVAPQGEVALDLLAVSVRRARHDDLTPQLPIGELDYRRLPSQV